MTCRLSVNNFYEQAITQHVIDDSRRQPLAEMSFADPEAVDGRASHPDSCGILMRHGFAVDPDTAPRKFLWSGGRRVLPEILQSQQVMIVNDRFRQLVEQFEPGVHQFIPVEVHVSKKDGPVATYWWFNVRNRVDTVDHERTTYVRKPGHGGSFYWADGVWDGPKYDKIANARIVFDERKAAGHHIWVEPELLTSGEYSVSEAFGEAAMAAGFTGLDVTARSSLHICRGD